jgi:peptidyl-prolyl cis-trans isomerase B (cyclophilin B)
MARREREQRRRRVVRRGVIITVIGAAVIATAALLFSGGSTPTTTTTSSTSTVPPTTTTTISPAVKAAQTTANAKALAAGCPALPSTRVNTLKWSKEPAITITKTQPLYAHVTTTAGDFVIQLLPAKALHTVNNFVFLADHKFYNCVIFHRVVKDFVIQGGDPTGTGAGGPGYTVVEAPPPGTQYVRGDVAMAKTQTQPSGASGSQFFIVTAANATQSAGLTPDYALLGKVVVGQDVVDAIGSLPTNPPGDGMPSPAVVMSSVTVTTP